jgi:hypothetical protein
MTVVVLTYGRFGRTAGFRTPDGASPARGNRSREPWARRSIEPASSRV